MKKQIFYLILSIPFCILIYSCRSVQLWRAHVTKDFSIPKFQKDTVARGTDVFHFHELDSVRSNYLFEQKHFDKQNLAEFIQKDDLHTAYLLIKNDTIIYEYYPEEFKADDLRQTFSISKVMLSALVGILEAEGVMSLDDSIVKYFPELTGEEGYWKDLTIGHLLNMQSGIAFQENEFSIPYYGILRLVEINDSKRYGLKATFDEKPGTSSSYRSIDSHLLGLIVETATSRSLSELLEEKIWSKIGSESDALWAIDSRKYGNTKGYCCIEARVRDVARFGNLFLNQGKYKDQQIIPSKWVEETFDTFNKDWCYQNYWWSTKKWPLEIYKDVETLVPNYIKDPDGNVMDTIIAKQKSRNCGAPYWVPGLYGQYLILFPEDDIICVRLGTSFSGRTLSNLKEIKSYLAVRKD